MSTSSTWEGWGEAATSATPSEKTSCSTDRMIRNRLRSTLSASRPPTIGRTRVGPELGEDDDADEGARVGEVVGVGAEDDVLHPGADVRGEGAEEDDAERAVAQGRPGRAAAGGDDGVPVDDRVLDLLEGDGPVVAPIRLAVGRGRHRPIVRERAFRPPAGSGAGGGADRPARHAERRGRRQRDSQRRGGAGLALYLVDAPDQAWAPGSAWGRGAACRPS